MAQAEALWVSDNFSEGDALASAVCIPNSESTPETSLCAEVICQADRYGGPGLGFSGGSGRCAVLGAVQIKGVGRTPLGTSKIDPFHSNGMVGFEEAMRETIWSEIARVALPFGSVHTLAVIDTGIDYNFEPPGETVETRRRFLLLRQFALRPAHYCRNVHFPTPINAETGLREDAVRTSNAVQALAPAFTQMFPACAATKNAVEIINIGLREVATRFAFQNATAMVKRLYHGGLSPSNIALDGRYLDFGTITTVSKFGRRAIRPLESDFSNEHTLLLNALLELRLFIAKYLKSSGGGKVISPDELILGFNAVYHRAQQIEFLKLTGICESTVMAFPVEKAERFRQCVMALIGHRNAPFVTWSGAWGPNNERPATRTLDVGNLLTALALSSNVADIQMRVAQEIGEICVAADFIGLYVELRHLYLVRSTSDVERRSLTLELALNAVRRNADLTFLDDSILLAKIGSRDATKTGVDDLVKSTVSHATEILSDKYDIARRLAESLKPGTKVPAEVTLNAILPGTAPALRREITSQWEALWNTAH
ncbi:hypothetical protein [Massilia sp. TWP1-3-3]|uniref:hypothetical protein n=1 Tax=Massilia sp. TWP1-3-3 TaxID=2804573 RepID=UPI003CF93EC9